MSLPPANFGVHFFAATLAILEMFKQHKKQSEPENKHKWETKFTKVNNLCTLTML